MVEGWRREVVGGGWWRAGAEGRLVVGRGGGCREGMASELSGGGCVHMASHGIHMQHVAHGNPGCWFPGEKEAVI